MKFAELIAALEKFFNDILGNVIPGGVLLLGLDLLKIPELLNMKRLNISDGGVLFIIVVIAYMLGHIIDQLNAFWRKTITSPIQAERASFNKSRKNLQFIPKDDREHYKTLLKEHEDAENKNQQISGVSNKKLEKIHEEIEALLKIEEDASKTRRQVISQARRGEILHNDHSLSIFEAWVAQQIKRLKFDGVEQNIKISDLRSIAMTLNEEGTILSRRFKFIELCCRGTATSLVILALFFLIISLLPPHDPKGVSSIGWIALIITAFIAYLLYARGNEFYRRSATACYDCAVADILKSQKPAAAAAPVKKKNAPDLIIKLLADKKDR